MSHSILKIMIKSRKGDLHKIFKCQKIIKKNKIKNQKKIKKKKVKILKWN